MKTLILFFLMLPSALSAQYSTPGTGVNWNMDSLVAYSGGVVTYNTDRYEVFQDVTVSAVDTLQITTNENIRIASAKLLTVAGVLLIDPPDQVVITALDTAQNYKGLRFENTDASIIRRTLIEFGGGIKLVGSDMIFDSCIVRRHNFANASGAVDAFQCSPMILRCEIYRNSRAGISSAANATSSPQILFNRIFENNTTNGNYPQINLGSGGADSIRIIGNEIQGFYNRAGGVALANLVGGSSIAVVRDNHVYNNRYGIACLGNNVTAVISHNVIEDNNTEGNPLTGGSGLNFNGTSSTNNSIVAQNVISGNLWGITIQGQANPRMGDLSNEDPGDDGLNSIYGNGNGGVTYGLYNNTPVAQKAENNDWGTPDLDSVEMVIFHHADSSVLGAVDYTPIFEVIRPVHMQIGELTGIGDSLTVGSTALGSFTIRNRGEQDLMIALKDTFGLTSSGRLTTGSTWIRNDHPGLRIRRVVDGMSRLKRAAIPDFLSTDWAANDSIVIYDPANDFLGWPTNTSGLVFPDVLKVTVKFGTFIFPYADFEIYFNAPADTNILGVMSFDMDQDFLTGLYPPLANLGLVPTDVGSEYEMVFTTSPTLAPVPAFMFASSDASLTPVAAATSIARSGPKVTFRLFAVPPFSFDDYPNANAACGFLATDGINALIGTDSTYAPRHIPDAAPDLGHAQRGVETNPSWLSFDVKADTLGGSDSVVVQVQALGSKPPGTYTASIVIHSNDSLLQRVTIPVSVTMFRQPQPVVSMMDLSVMDTISPNSGKDIPVNLTNNGAGDFRYFILDTTGIPWLRIQPSFGTIAAGASESFTISLFDSVGLPEGNYLANVLMVNNDTNQTVVTLPIQMTVRLITDVPGISDGLPRKFTLDQNHPNPFNPSTEVHYALASPVGVELAVYNILGQKVRTLVNAYQEAGEYRIGWDGRDDRGHGVATGVYFYRLTAGDFVRTRRMLLLK